jgi:hypothetical protein
MAGAGRKEGREGVGRGRLIGVEGQGRGMGVRAAMVTMEEVREEHLSTGHNVI